METPYYLIDEKKLLRNLKIIQRVRTRSGAKSVLALKCFSTWSVFELMREYMDGTTSSSLYEARLGREKFGGEVHAYSVAFSPKEFREVRRYADKVIFNSFSQLDALVPDIKNRKTKVGIRINPGISYSHFDLADPARRYSRLGVRDIDLLRENADRVSGAMFHFNCENADIDHFSASLDRIGSDYGELLRQWEWVSLGGGLYFTQRGYPVDRFCARLKAFAETFGVQVYLEPGEAAITGCGELVTTVLDVVRNETDIAVVDATTEGHMLDLLIYRLDAKIASPLPGPHRFTIAGRTCLAGDVFGTYDLKTKLKPGSVVRIADAAGYTMVKTNWFNGIPMPAIWVRRLDGTLDKVKAFSYKDYLSSLS
ncbi:MAG: carboxynorspermidine decarboxylase [Kiritimatiellales bacterium]|nr:carboxynorspermidine decarboxylase [Kiritimatiellales bacterium]